MSRKVVVSREAVQAVLDDGLRTRLQAHAGDIEIVSITTEGDVRLRFLGGCGRCPLRPATLGMAVVPRIETLPGVRSVTAEGVNVSTIALKRMAHLVPAQVT